MLEPIQHHSLWGQVFEIAVKRGVLAALLGSKLGKPADLGLEPWKAKDAGDVFGALARELGEVDPNVKARTRETARHLFELGMGLGQTALREYLKRLKGEPEDYAIRALWCPLQLPRLEGDFDAETQAARAEFQAAFGLDGPLDPALTHKGFPVRADFLLWLEPQYASLDRQLLCLEFSLNGLPPTADYTEPDAHLEELLRYAWHMDTRSVFSSVCAEVSGEQFRLSPRLKQHLPAFTGRDKPLYKLCQAASYVCTTLRWFKTKGLDDRPCNARALSITQNGFESLSARFCLTPNEADPKVGLMRSLGHAYRKAEKVPEGDEAALEDHIRSAFDSIRKALPKAMRGPLAEMREVPAPGKSVAFIFSETVEGFFNPMQELPWQEAQDQMDADEALERFFRQAPKPAVTAALALSGYGGGGYTMEGFLPRKPGARRRRLEALLPLGLPVVVFESPYRLLKLLEEIGAWMPARQVCVARELTKMNEECRWGTAAELQALFAARFAGRRLKGEIVLVIAPADGGEAVQSERGSGISDQ